MNYTLLKAFPRLYKFQLIELVHKHFSSVGVRAHKGGEYTDFEKLLMSGNVDRLVKFLGKVDDLNIKFDKYSPPEILANEKIMMVAIEKNPSNIYLLDDDKISSKMLKFIEEQLSKKENHIYIHFPLKSFFYKSEKLIDVCLHLESLDGYYFAQLLSSIDEFCPNNLDKAIIIGRSRKLIDRQYHYLYSDSLLKNSSVVESFDTLSVPNIYRIFKINPELARTTFIRLIHEKRLFMDESINISDYMDFFGNNDVITAIYSDNEYLSYFSDIELFDKIKIDIQYFSQDNMRKFLQNLLANGKYSSANFASTFWNSFEAFRLSKEVGLPNSFFKGFSSSVIDDYVLSISNFTTDDFSFLIGIDAFSEKNINYIFNRISFSDFISFSAVRRDLFSLSKLISVEDDKLNSRLLEVAKREDSNDNFIVEALLVLRDCNKVNSPEIDKNKSFLLEKIIRLMILKGFDKNAVKEYIEKVLNGKRDPFTLLFASNEKTFNFANRFGDFYSNSSFECVNNFPNEVINKLNRKHLVEIMKLLGEKHVIEGNMWDLAIKIYVTLGYERAVNFLSSDSKNNYGSVDESALLKIFGGIDLRNIVFEQKGDGYIPVINNQLINVIFGNSNKVKNTPIRNFLSNYMDKREEIEKKIDAVRKDQTLTEEEKESVISKYREQLSKYEKNINEFFSYVAKAFNEWDIIEEEFLKKVNNSKLGLKLTPSVIVEILKNVEYSRRLPLDSVRDAKFIESGVLDYVGYDTKYTDNPSQAPSRALYLSRKMEGKYDKRFPNVSVSSGGYTMRVFHPQDRKLLKAGYLSECCFRPNGNADNSGKDNSLLYYCATNEYGGGVEIVDEKGDTIMFSPILRNGNVLMIHSAETLKAKLPAECNGLLKTFAQEIIKVSQENGDNIDFVTMTDLHSEKFDMSVTEGLLLTSKKFSVFDPDSKYGEMYNNLDQNHLILAHREGKMVEDISYGPVETTYHYDRERSLYKLDVDEDIVRACIDLDRLKTEIISLSNLRVKKISDGLDEEAYQLLNEIKKLKKQHLDKYKSILDMRKGKDFYQDAKSAINTISRISGSVDFESLLGYTDILYSNDWYIIVTRDSKIICDCLESGREDMKEQLEKLLNTTRLTFDDNSKKSI